MEPLLFCIAGPTASGKSTVCKQVVTQLEAIRLSVSTTTRAPRAGEVDGRDYHFVSEEEFSKRVATGAFIEHAQFSGNMYGTEWSNVEAAKNESVDLIFEIEVQGVEQLRQRYQEKLITVFIFPVSFEVLEKRLRARASDTEEQIQRRLARAREEVALLRSPAFSDFLVINDSLDDAVADVRSIIESERCRLSRYSEADMQALLK